MPSFALLCKAFTYREVLYIGKGQRHCTGTTHACKRERVGPDCSVYIANIALPTSDLPKVSGLHRWPVSLHTSLCSQTVCLAGNVTGLL